MSAWGDDQADCSIDEGGPGCARSLRGLDGMASPEFCAANFGRQRGGGRGGVGANDEIGIKQGDECVEVSGTQRAKESIDNSSLVGKRRCGGRAAANAFARATWIARSVERDAMFAASPPALTRPSTYAALTRSRTVAIGAEDHDVFGDGTVVMKLAAGHTPGHQVLFVKLPKTGPIVLSGDLYHYPEERALGRVPTFEADQQKTVASRAAIDAFLRRSGARLWIQHDLTGMSAVKKAPAFYE